MLHALPEVTTEMGTAIIARLKVLGSLDIAKHRLPQDGQFAVEIPGEPVSLRIAALPCHYGRKAVLRLLHQVDQSLEIVALGMQDAQLAAFSQALQQPQGLILATGPAGSGKAVALYSALQTQNTPDVNLCSVENPIEIPIAGLNQMQIHPRTSLTLQRVLCALLHQNSDVAMVGETRDSEAVEIAPEAVQTDHLILPTLHTNSISETLVCL